MIKLRRFNNSSFVLNAEIIQMIEETPDTMITLVNGQRILVLDSIEEVTNMIIEYKRKILADHSH